MTYGSADYRIEMAHRHLDNYEGQMRAAPDDTDPDALEGIASRLDQLAREALRAAGYSRLCRVRKVEAEARVDALLDKAA